VFACLHSRQQFNNNKEQLNLKRELGGATGLLILGS